MLRVLGDAVTGPAYRVPWMVDRAREPTILLWNIGDEPVHGVRLTLHGDGSVIFAADSRVAPGGHATFRVDGCPGPASIVTLRWFRPDETEYLWRIAF